MEAQEIFDVIQFHIDERTKDISKPDYRQVLESIISDCQSRLDCLDDEETGR